MRSLLVPMPRMKLVVAGNVTVGPRKTRLWWKVWAKLMLPRTGGSQASRDRTTRRVKGLVEKRLRNPHGMAAAARGSVESADVPGYLDLTDLRGWTFFHVVLDSPAENEPGMPEDRGVKT